MTNNSTSTPPIETTPELPIDSSETTVIQNSKPTFSLKKSRLPYILGGILAILVSLALAITFFSRPTTKSPTTSTSTNVTDAPPGYVTYTNATYFYSIAIPQEWGITETSPDQSGKLLIQTDAPALLEIESFKSTNSNLEEYFGTLQDGRSSSKSSTVKVGEYDAIERFESWPKTSLQPVITYLQIQDQIYIFRLIPSSGKNAISSESLLKEYRNILSTFKLTTTVQLGKDWVRYDSSPVEGLAFPSFFITHPQSWAIKEKSENGNLVVSIYRNNYEITITQAAVGGAVCLFKDSPDFKGSSGDLRSKEYFEFTTNAGSIMRRYFNLNQGEKSTYYFCQKETSTAYFATPTTFGGIVYYVPAKFDPNIVKEMDDIIKTITPNNPSITPTPQPATNSATTP